MSKVKILKTTWTRVYKEILEDYSISFRSLQILKINGADTAASRDNIQDLVVIIFPICYVIIFPICYVIIFPILDDHVIIIYFLPNQ
jgi:hypothetical protein